MNATAVSATRSEQRLQPSESTRSTWLIGLTLGVSLLWGLFMHAPHGVSALTAVQDDFFYYEKIAAAIAAGHGSTFNGIVPTNGYHPLWMGVLVLLCTKFHDPRHLITAVYAVIAASVLVTYFFAGKILHLVDGGRVWTADLLAAALALLCLDQFRSGMEVILTIPLGACLFYLLLAKQGTIPRFLVTAFVASLVVLSRLDAVIWICMLGAGFVLSKPKANPRQVFAVALGFLPLPLYFLMNKLVFATLMPVSGQAKQLRTTHTMSFAALRSFATLTKKEDLLVALALLGLVLVGFRIKQFPMPWRTVLVATLLFPPAHLLLLSFLSDWPVWPWYFYSWALADLVTLVLIMQWLTDRVAPLVASVALVLCGFGITQFIFQRAMPPGGRVLSGLFLEQFAQTHPGVYAMGDRAGIAGVLMPYPIVQTEGLVMDEAYLSHLDKQEPLLPVLQSYGVRYYVANFYGGGIPRGCYLATEPSMAGLTAKHMSSTICTPPLATFSDSGTQLAIYGIAK